LLQQKWFCETELSGRYGGSENFFSMIFNDLRKIIEIFSILHTINDATEQLMVVLGSGSSLRE
jgi:hypothetical protein